MHTISQTTNRDYAVQGYSLCPTINCYYCKKNNYGQKNYTLYVAIKEKKKQKSSDKGKLWAAYSISSNNIQKLASLVITINKDKL